ncbi:unnamed protein product [Thlaspi arvense]|uniref:Uncharacterized protein n=1 Tax=Thlaspi arvense TaxID=13288 RepID=A0AAU9T3A4_THLAR|nr:unnamed protein product [Thlaspi arvense]
MENQQEKPFRKKLQKGRLISLDSPPMVTSSSEMEESGVKKLPARVKKDIVMDEAFDSWNHLIENPNKWWGHRENNANGLVKPRHPDFKNKDSNISLWLNNAPDWILPKLEGLEFPFPCGLSRARLGMEEAPEFPGLDCNLPETVEIPSGIGCNLPETVEEVEELEFLVLEVHSSAEDHRSHLHHLALAVADHTVGFFGSFEDRLLLLLDGQILN